MSHENDSLIAVDVMQVVETQVASVAPGTIESKPHHFAVYTADLTPFNVDHEIDGLPFKLEGERLEALRRSLIEHGQTSPIIVDENDNVIDGRARLTILRELKKGAFIITVNSEEATKFAFAGLTNREMTVMDEARLIKWVEEHGLEEMPIEYGELKDTREKISLWLKLTLSWNRRGSPRTIGNYQKLNKLLEKASPDEKVAVAESASVTKAMTILKEASIPKPPKADGEMAKLRKSIDKFCIKIEAISDSAYREDLEKLKAAISTAEAKLATAQTN